MPFKAKRTKAAFAAAFIIFALYSLTIIFIMGWAFLQSLKTNREFINDLTSLPKSWLFSNYSQAFSSVKHGRTAFFGMFVNSIWFAAGMSVISVFMHCVTGYCFAKYKFIGRQTIFSFVLFTLIIPIVGALPSLYRIIYTMGANDSPLFLITALGGFGSNFLIMYAFFKSIDWSYAEACFIDGGGHFYVFFRIMLPLAAGPVTALSIVGIIAQWNNYETPILFLDKMPTLASGLYHYKEVARYESNEPVYLAGVLLSTLPILVLVAAFGNKVMKNMTMGGLKG